MDKINIKDIDMEKELDEIKKIIESIFHEKKEEAKAAILKWGIRILDLHRIREQDPGLAEIAKKSEQYAWAAIFALYAQEAKQIEESTWVIVEKLLVLIRKIFLS